MLTFLPHPLRGCLSGLALALNTLLHFPAVVVVALAREAVPSPGFRRLCWQGLNVLSSTWIHVNSLWMGLTQDLEKQYTVCGLEELSPDRSYLVTANHQSWADIFIAQHLLNGRIPQMKFLLKRELIRVPVIGLCWWALGFPFMQRHSRAYLKAHPEKAGDDLEAIRRACEKFRGQPTAIFNFMEGTRFTPEKHAGQSTPYAHLLKPRGAGTGLVLSTMGEQLDTLLDLTFHYRDGAPQLWNFLCGRVGRVTVVAETVPIPEDLLGRDYATDSRFRSSLQRWIKERWEKKDALLDRLADEGSDG